MFLVAGTELAVKRPSTREQRADWLHRFCARSLRGMDIGIEVTGEFPKRGTLISNHLSYLDIIVFAALHPCVFVSKEEIGRWPVVGWMTTMSGTVYVARGHGGSALKAREGMQAALDAGLPVVFFPEGTTSNGSGLLKFHSGLLAQVIQGGSPVTAAYMRYRFVEENGPGVSVVDDVCYWGDRNMLAHIFKFLGCVGCGLRCDLLTLQLRFRAMSCTERWRQSRRRPRWQHWQPRPGNQECTISDSTNVHLL